MKLFFCALLIVFLLLSAADVISYRRIRQAGKSMKLHLFLLQAVLCPIVLMLIPAIAFVSGDNGLLVVRIQMFLLTIWIVASFIKAIIYIILLLLGSSQRVAVSAFLISSLLLYIMLSNVFRYRTNIVVRNVTVECNGLPRSFDGYRIVLFSDLHLGTMMNAEEECSSVVDTINSIKHDLTVFAGDLVTIRHQEITPGLVGILSQIERHDGIIAVQGNHDVGYYIVDTMSTHVCDSADGVIGSESRMGWSHLRDSSVFIRRGTDSIAVTGIGYSELREGYKHWSRLPMEYDPHPILDSLPYHIFSIVVAHQPQFWRNILPCRGGDLTLSGHVHACQLVMNVYGLRISPASLIYDKWSGLYEDNGKHLYVNDGIGCVGYFLRIGARPEISVLELRCR